MSSLEYIDSNGEILTQDVLVERIHRLLNQFDDTHQSVISPEIVAHLDLNTLGAIYESLLARNGKEIQNNQEWLFSLVDF
ncbi:hypothetical protein BBW65_04435 [Helicobacter enhydrae]|uniref:Uncharacterized protein n=1 Tax=Helicobacter enhydrae TaxID=222136 RepID=A0A1B1U5P1_9HELI|nr:hypothetical protein [Helicobacter enhydrae]ANV98093.1 hypothetical protein BBW65_04435 [Helicobacter enhydrae]